MKSEEFIITKLANHKIKEINFNADLVTNDGSVLNIDTYEVSYYTDFAISGSTNIAGMYCNRKVQLSLHNADYPDNIEFTFMLFNSYGNCDLQPDTKFYKLLFEHQGINCPSTIAIDTEHNLYVLGIYNYQSKWCLEFTNICKLPAQIYTMLWDNKFNNKRPFSFYIDPCALVGFITNYLGYKDLIKSLEIHIQGLNRKYYAFNTSGFIRCMTYDTNASIT